MTVECAGCSRHLSLDEAATELPLHATPAGRICPDSGATILEEEIARVA